MSDPPLDPPGVPPRPDADETAAPLPRLDAVVLRMVARMLEEGRVERSWLLDLLRGERARLVADGALVEGGEPPADGALEELADRWLERRAWRRDLELIACEQQAGRLAMAVLGRLQVEDELPEMLAACLSRDDALTIAGAIALLARISSSEVETFRWTDRFLRELGRLEMWPPTDGPR